MKFKSHPDDKVFDKETPFNEMEIYFIKSAYEKVNIHSQTHWQDSGVKPYAEQVLLNIKKEINNGLTKPTKGIYVGYFVRYFSENGIQDSQKTYVALAYYLISLTEGHSRIIHKENFHKRLEFYKL